MCSVRTIMGVITRLTMRLALSFFVIQINLFCLVKTKIQTNHSKLENADGHVWERTTCLMRYSKLPKRIQ